MVIAELEYLLDDFKKRLKLLSAIEFHFCVFSKTATFALLRPATISGESPLK